MIDDFFDDFFKALGSRYISALVLWLFAERDEGSTFLV